MSEEEKEFSKTVSSEFDKETAIEESKNFLADLLLKDPQSGESLFVATNVQMNEDGSISVVCVKDVDSDDAIMHTIFSGHVSKAAPEEKKEEGDIIVPSGNIVGLDGQPIT